MTKLIDQSADEFYNEILLDRLDVHVNLISNTHMLQGMHEFSISVLHWDLSVEEKQEQISVKRRS